MKPEFVVPKIDPKTFIQLLDFVPGITLSFLSRFKRDGAAVNNKANGFQFTFIIKQTQLVQYGCSIVSRLHLSSSLIVR